MADDVGEQPQTDVLLADDDNTSDNDSALGESTASSTASLASSILEYRKENGRTYHAYKEGSYHFPNDERENERLDLQHHIFYLTLEGKLGLSPPCQTGSKFERVLDVGTGTGIWAIDYGDEYPDTEVIGIDLSATQPAFVPNNVFFQVDDLEDAWTYNKPFDFIHSRMMNSSVSNWPAYIKKCYENLKPGGYLELQEFTLPLSDDGTLKPEHALQRSMDLLGEAAAKFNHAFVDLNALKDMLTAAGFEGVVEVRYKWPSNTWPREKKYKELGLWNHQNMIQGMSGFLMAALTRALGWSKEEVDVLDVQTRLDLKNKTIHAYWPIYVVYGKKPEAAATAE